MAVDGVYFKCSMVTWEKLTKSAMDARIRDFLNEKLETDIEVTSCYIIQTLNPRERARECVETLTRYLENIIFNPEEPKFYKIRLKNRVFQDKVATVNGAHDFLTAAGFKLQNIWSEESAEFDDFYVFWDNKFIKAQRMLDLLLSTKPIIPELDRNIKVLRNHGDRVSRFEMPPEFYDVTGEEMKREQIRKLEQVEKDSTLRTRAMREQEDKRKLPHYEYTVLRIKFPDGIILQGTFSVREKLSNVQEFVRNCLVNDWQPFNLITATGTRLTQMDYTLLKLRLMPSVVIHFAWDSEIAQDLMRETGLKSDKFLNAETLTLIQEMIFN